MGSCRGGGLRRLRPALGLACCAIVIAPGCSDPVEQALPVHPPTAHAVAGADDAAPRTWHRVGRVDRIQLEAGGGFTGARAALSRCPESRPCVAEGWVPDGDGDSVVLTISAGRVEDSTGARWRRRWTALSGPLPACLGDPLADPPGGDPAAVRTLEERDGSRWWRLLLAGHDRCGIEGILRLRVDADRVDARALRCGDLPWHAGGSDAALARLRAWLRVEAVTAWPDATLQDRQLWIDLLEEDPEARPLLDELRAMP